MYRNKSPIIIEHENSDLNINEKIKDIDISEINSIKFQLSSGKKFEIKSKNLFKIVKLIINNLGKTTFKAGELEKIYSTIINNYKSELNEADYRKLLGVIKDFVDVGGSVEIVSKK